MFTLHTRPLHQTLCSKEPGCLYTYKIIKQQLFRLMKSGIYFVLLVIQQMLYIGFRQMKRTFINDVQQQVIYIVVPVIVPEFTFLHMQVQRILIQSPEF
jgi:hypothetical protein